MDLPESVTALVDALPDGILFVDDDGRIVFTNGQLDRLSGYQDKELVGLPIEMLVPEELGPPHTRHRRQYAETPATRPMGSGLEIQLRRKDGRLVRVDIALSRIATGASTLTLAAVRDVTEQKRAEEFLRENRVRLATLDEKERIGRELQGGIIHAIFAAGMELQSAVLLVTEDDAKQRIQETITRLDGIIAELRSHIFSLG